VSGQQIGFDVLRLDCFLLLIWPLLTSSDYRQYQRLWGRHVERHTNRGRSRATMHYASESGLLGYDYDWELPLVW
jgi:hypothetical protein